VQKVINLLQEMGEKGKAGKEAEQVAFAQFKVWCENIKKQKEADLESLDLAINTLSANIEQNQAAMEENSATITEAETHKGHWTSDIDAATKVRAIERKDFQVTSKDYQESIDALERAIPVLKEQDFDRKQVDKSDAFTQISRSRIVPSNVKTMLTQLVESRDPVSYKAPEANAYEFHADHIVSLLEGLLVKFRDQWNTLAKEEDASQHSFDILLQELTNDIAEAERTIVALTKENTALSEDTVLKQTQLTDTQATLASDTAYLKDTESMCVVKAQEYTARQQLRTEELEAISKAVEIISSGAVTGAAEKHLQTDSSSADAFVQLLSSSVHSAPARKAAEYLQSQSRRLDSHVLSAIASKIEASPFDKVITMIKELVDKLVAQVNDEATQKGWCDTELAKNEHSRTTLTSDVEQLKNEIDELDASIAKTNQEILDLNAALSDLEKAVAEASAQRRKDSANNAQTVSDAKAAEQAVEQALAILEEFYEKAGQATALAQQQPSPPPTWEKAYTGMTERSGGVIGMLQVILSDFTRLAADTVSEEEADQREYEKFIEDARVEKAQKDTDVKHKSDIVDRQNDSRTEAVKDLRTAQKQLDAAMDYFDKLKPTCIHTDMSHEERMRRRDEEIQSLKEALRILNGEEVASA
jgi:chromosome segregation ATPase